MAANIKRPAEEQAQTQIQQNDANCRIGSMELDEETCRFYHHAIEVLDGSGVPYLVGGAFALERYTGIERYTKDFDVFVRPEHAETALKAFEREGYETEMTFPHWLGKAHHGDMYVDVIFSSGNGLAEVDDLWFDNAREAEVLGCRVMVVPPEEMIWSKTFVMERERYDGADVAHMIRATANELDWRRLIGRYGRNWRVLFSHLVLFGFVYPGERGLVPSWVLEHFTERLREETHSPPPAEADKLCQGTLISRQQYLIDVEQWGYTDARTLPMVKMTEDDIEHWTESIKVDGEGA
ncbi:MAG TPA: nucleotidyltransferase [Chloroflexia bacterium]|nr:nucleotidyltransferase [Chloroflexia bacterium]